MQKILIVGVRSGFAKELKTQFKGKFKFCFVTDQDRIAKKKKGNYDAIIVLLKFTNHNSEHAYNSHTNYIRIGDGMGQAQILPILNKLLEMQS